MNMIELILKQFKNIFMPVNTWYIIANNAEYKRSVYRYEEIREAKKRSKNYKEKMLLAFLINQYEQRRWSLAEADPIEVIKIRMEEFGFKPIDLANKYGDKGTISKVLNYKQPLSLTMIRLFSKMLRIPHDVLAKEYKLAG